MYKLATLSIALALIFLPLVTVRQRVAKRAWARSLVYLGIFNVLYVAAVVVALPLLGLE